MESSRTELANIDRCCEFFKISESSKTKLCQTTCPRAAETAFPLDRQIIARFEDGGVVDVDAKFVWISSVSTLIGQ